MHDSRVFRTNQRWALAVCAGGIVLCGLLSWDDPDRLWRAYLFAFIACWLVVMGATGLLALGNATGGRWTEACRPFYLALAQTFPLVAVLFIPVAMNLRQIFPWAAEATRDEQLFSSGKAAYLEPRFFLGRAIAYFVVWAIVVGLLSWFSRLRTLQADSPGMRRVGALSLVLLVPTVTFAAFDWGMSLEPEWYSSIYGAILTAGGVLAAHALAICGLAITAHSNESRDGELFNDVGNLLLAFLMVFTYFAFSQFLIIWSGNLPAEITWYARRLGDGWQWLAVAIVVFHYFVPFLMLLSRDLKRTPRRLAGVAVLLAVMYAAHVYWTIVPAFADSGVVWQATNVAALAALGGGLLAAFFWHAQRLIATADRKLASSDSSME
ncbi:MAG: hypothetical protein WD669_07870 [Pirellulales bacterium]